MMCLSGHKADPHVHLPKTGHSSIRMGVGIIVEETMLVVVAAVKPVEQIRMNCNKVYRQD